MGSAGQKALEAGAEPGSPRFLRAPRATLRGFGRALFRQQLKASAHCFLMGGRQQGRGLRKTPQAQAHQGSGPTEGRSRGGITQRPEEGRKKEEGGEQRSLLEPGKENAAIIKNGGGKAPLGSPACRKVRRAEALLPISQRLRRHDLQGQCHAVGRNLNRTEGVRRKFEAPLTTTPQGKRQGRGVQRTSTECLHREKGPSGGSSKPRPPAFKRAISNYGDEYTDGGKR